VASKLEYLAKKIAFSYRMGWVNTIKRGWGL